MERRAVAEARPAAGSRGACEREAGSRGKDGRAVKFSQAVSWSLGLKPPNARSVSGPGREGTRWDSAGGGEFRGPPPARRAPSPALRRPEGPRTGARKATDLQTPGVPAPLEPHC